MSFPSMIANHRLVVCCGSGGVGKTTTSAAIALQAAAMGRKTLVITIDPAKRLAQSLGLEGLDNEERPVPRERLIEAGFSGDGEIHAAMLDTAASLASLIRRIASDEQQARRIIENKIYRQFTNAIAGSQEYVAMERLYDLMETRDYDLIVLDTPPTKNALDFLNAPSRLATFLDESVVKWFVKPDKPGMGARLFAKGGEVVFRLLGVLVGKNFIHDLVDFFQAFNGLYGGFKQRAEKVNQLLRSDSTVFVLVTSAEHNAISESLYFYRKLTDADIPVHALVVNRAYQLLDGVLPDAGDLAGLLQNGSAVSSSSLADRLAAKLKNLHEIGHRLNAIARGNIERLQESLSGSETIATVPVFGEDIHDIDGLMRMNSYLFET